MHKKIYFFIMLVLFFASSTTFPMNKAKSKKRKNLAKIITTGLRFYKDSELKDIDIEVQVSPKSKSPTHKSKKLLKNINDPDFLDERHKKNMAKYKAKKYKTDKKDTTGNSSE